MNHARALLRTSGSITWQQVRPVTIYTRGGDKGRSSLFNGERRAKSDLVFEALGSGDELSAFLGQAKSACQLLPLSPDVHLPLSSLIHHVQESLLRVGSHLATPPSSLSSSSSSSNKIIRTQFDGTLVSWLEKCIDRMDCQLPPLTSFLIPRGGTSGTLHQARAVCRRFERDVVRLVESGHPVDPDVPKFVNRLSDFLFMAARYADHLSDLPDDPFISSTFQSGQHPI